MARYQLTHDPETVKEIEPDGTVHWTPVIDPTYQAWLAEGNTPDPADPLPVRYQQAVQVDAHLRTTDATPHEILRVPCDVKHLYQANLTISGVDAGNFASKIMEGRFTWKRPAAVAIVVGLTVVSDIHDTVAASWLPNYAASGTDIVFTVQGAAGRVVDWLLVGEIGTFAPEGLVP